MRTRTFTRRPRRLTRVLLALMLVSAWTAEEGTRPFRHLSPFSYSALRLIAPETDAALRALLESKRGLAFTTQPDALDPVLRAYAARKGKNYLRVTVRNRDEYDQLRRPMAARNGRLVELDSPLYDILRNGGVLFLDYAQSDPKLAEEFNSLFDRVARFEGREVSPDLIVVGGMNRRHFARHPTSFYSRYNEVRNLEFPESDPVKEKVKTVEAAAFRGRRANLHFSSRAPEELVGKFFFTPSGKLEFGKPVWGDGKLRDVAAGELIAALREGVPLLLENAPWENEAFAHFIRQLLIQGGVRANGEWIPLKEGFALCRPEKEPDPAGGVQRKKVISPALPAAAGPHTWVINTETADLLFSIPQINDDGQMTQQPGLLDRPQETVRLRVTEPLPEEIWHRIFHAAGAVEIEVVNPEWAPAAYRSFVDEDFKKPAAAAPALSWEAARGKKAFYLKGEDLSAARAVVAEKLEVQEESFWVYPVTPETTLADLTENTAVEPGEGDLAIRFAPRLPENGVLAALQAGKTVILEGVDRNPQLMRQLETLLAPQPYLVVNGAAVSLKFSPGRLVLTGKTDFPEGVGGAATAALSSEETDAVLRRAVGDDELHARLIRLRDLFRKLPLPYPFELGLDKVRMLLQFPRPAEAFDAVFLNPYIPYPKLHATMRAELVKEFGGPEKVTLPPLNRSGEDQMAEIQFILEHFRMVFFNGLPGVGKSYICGRVGEELGYADDEIYPVLSGADTQEANLIAEGKYDKENRRSYLEDKQIARWAKNPKGGLLVWDEANLTQPHFAQFLSGLAAAKPYVWVAGERIELTDRHRVIFTGNPETMEERRHQHLLMEKAVTLHFAPFSPQFLREKIREIIPVSMEKPQELVEWILELHQFFENARPEFGYSLRDIQELASRARVAGNDRAWDRDSVLYLAWNLYGGLLDREEREALRALLESRYATSLRDAEKMAGERARRFVERHAAEYEGIGWARGALETVEAAEDFLKMRKARKGGRGKREYLGKWALLLEGPSGTGKDDLAERTLRAHGLAERRDYEVWVASPYKIDELKEILKEAADKGKVVVLSEMNLVSTAVLEGMLNALLTEQGVFKPGFAVIGTINSTDFQGREAFSTAFKNRLNTHRVFDHSQAGLLEVAQSQFTPEEWFYLRMGDVVPALIGCHCWLRDKAAGPHQRPTLREFFRALERLGAGEPVEPVLRAVYGPVYFENLLSGEKMPPVAEFARYKEKDPVDWEKAYRIAAQVVIGDKAAKLRFIEGEEGKHPRPEMPAQNRIFLAGKGGAPEAWSSVLSGAARHRLRHAAKGASVPHTDPAYSFYLALELARLQRGAEKFRLAGPAPLHDPEARLLLALSRLDLDAFLKTTEQDLLVSLTLLVALGKTGLEQPGLAELCEAAGKPELLARAREALPPARKFLEALPETLSEADVAAAQAEAIRQFEPLREIYARCSAEAQHFSPYEEEPGPEAAPPAAGFSVAVPSRSPEEALAEIARQQTARREAQRKGLAAELQEAPRQLRRPLDGNSGSAARLYRAKLREWPRRAAELGADIEEEARQIGRLLQDLESALSLNRELDTRASEIAYGVNQKPIQQLLDEAEAEGGLFDRVMGLEKRNFWRGDLILKMTRLRSFMIRNRYADRLRKGDGKGPTAEEILGKDFKLNAPSGAGDAQAGSNYAGGESDYSGGYIEESHVSRRAFDYYTPYVFPHLRMTVQGRIDQTTVSRAQEKEFREVPFEKGTAREWKEKGFQVFEAKIEIDLVPGEKVLIPSVGDEQHFFDLSVRESLSVSLRGSEATEAISPVKIYKDSDDLYYAESAGRAGPFTLACSVAVPNRYFGVEIPDDMETPAAAKPETLSADVAWGLKAVGLDPSERRVKKILRTLAAFIHSFNDKPIPEEKRTGNSFRDTLHFKSGACAQRAHAFAVLARALGLRARMVSNSDRDGKGLHSFPEVFIPGSGWLRIGGLGGQATEIREKPLGRRHQPNHETDLTRPEAVRSAKRKPARADDAAAEAHAIPRDGTFRQITHQDRARLEKLLEHCFYSALKGTGDRRPSQHGSHLSVQRLAQDPMRAYFSVAPKISRLPKRLILAGPFDPKSWNPYLAELIFYLLEEGTQIAVYEGEETEPYPVRSVGELKARLAKAPEVSETMLYRYVTRECNPETTAAVSLRDLQRRVEAFYLDAQFLVALDAPSEDADPSSAIASEAKQSPSETSPHGWIREAAPLAWKKVDRSDPREEKQFLAMSRNGKFYATYDIENGVRLWESATDRQIPLSPDLEKLRSAVEPIGFCSVSDSGEFVILAGDKLDVAVGKESVSVFPKKMKVKTLGMAINEENRLLYFLSKNPDTAEIILEVIACRLENGNFKVAGTGMRFSLGNEIAQADRFQLLSREMPAFSARLDGVLHWINISGNSPEAKMQLAGSLTVPAEEGVYFVHGEKIAHQLRPGEEGKEYDISFAQIGERRINRNPHEAVLSPDGKTLAFYYPNSPFVYFYFFPEGARGGQLVRHSLPMAGLIMSVQFLPAGRGIKVEGDDGSIYRLERPEPARKLSVAPSSSLFAWLRDPRQPTSVIQPQPRRSEDEVETVPVSRNEQYHAKMIGENTQIVNAAEGGREVSSEKARVSVLATDDGELVISRVENRIAVYFSSTKNKKMLVEAGGGAKIRSFALNPEEDTLYFVHEGATNELYRLRLPLSFDEPVEESTLVWTSGFPIYLLPDGTGFLEREREGLTLHEFGSKKVSTFPLPSQVGFEIHDVTISPDHQLVVFRGGDMPALYFVPVGSNEYFIHYLDEEEGNRHVVSGIRFAPSGEEFRVYLVDGAGKPFVRRWRRPATLTPEDVAMLAADPENPNPVMKEEAITAKDWLEVKSNLKIAMFGEKHEVISSSAPKSEDEYTILIDDEFQLELEGNKRDYFWQIKLKKKGTPPGQYAARSRTEGVAPNRIAVQGRKYAYQEGGFIYIQDIDSRQVEQISVEGNVVGKMAFSPGGTGLAAVMRRQGDGGSEVWIYKKGEWINKQRVGGAPDVVWINNHALVFSGSRKKGFLFSVRSPDIPIFFLPKEFNQFAEPKFHRVPMEEGKEDRLLVVGEKTLYHAPVSEIQPGFNFEAIALDSKVAKIELPHEIVQVAVGPEIAAVLTVKGEVWLCPILSHGLMSHLVSPQSLQINLGNFDDYAIASTWLSFSPDGKELHAQTPDTSYTWKFVSRKRDILAEFKKMKQDGSFKQMILSQLLTSLVDREAALKEVRAAMERRGRLAEFEALYARLAPQPISDKEIYKEISPSPRRRWLPSDNLNLTTPSLDTSL